MKTLLTSYAHYHSWANAIASTSIATLTRDQQHQEINSSFNSLYKTVNHVWGAETLWLQRLNGEPQPSMPGDRFAGNFAALAAAWHEADATWINWVDGCADEALLAPLTYRNMKGDAFTQPLWEMVMQVFNHSTYHRGQLITMMRQVGLTNVPNTDFISWTRLPR